MKKNFYLLFISLLTTLNVIASGLDVKVHPDPTIDQANVKMDIAFNGWIYEAFTTYDSAAAESGVSIYCSKDDGTTWSYIDGYSIADVMYSSVDIIVAGTDTNSLDLYVAAVRTDINSAMSLIFIDKYNATTFDFVQVVLNTGLASPVYDLAIATDYRFPSSLSAPYSIALAYSRFGAVTDSVSCYISEDAGTTFTNFNVASTSSYFRKVSLAYGKSASGSNGRYFIAYEQLETSADRNGHIYTSRNTSTILTPFIDPVNLDSLNPDFIGLCKNPEIAVQMNTLDNDSMGTSAVILFDYDYETDGSDYDVLGYYNKVAHFGNNWNPLTVVATGNSEMRSDITYDPAHNTFLTTYLDSTDGFLPYSINLMNLVDPDTWINIIATSADANTGLDNAYPVVADNPAKAQPGFAWNRTENNRGVAYFDAEYRTLTAIESPEFKNAGVNIYPNPATDVVTIDVNNFSQKEVMMLVFDAQGKVVMSDVITGSKSIAVDAFNSGIYILQLSSEGKAVTSKLIKK